MPDPTPAPNFPPDVDVVARASNEYRIKRYIMVFILVGAGAWFGYDGFVGWPGENAQAAKFRKDLAEVQAKPVQGPQETEKAKQIQFELSKLKEHSDTDLLFQRVLCFTLPPLGLVVLVFSLRNSRGEYRLTPAGVLSVPGHPPVPLDAITAIDKTDWDRKGIAYLDYTLDNGTTGQLRLDDFIYQRPPTDEIFKRVEEHTGTADAETTAGV